MKKFIAIFFAKIAIILGKIMKRGSSFPGYIAIRIDPNIGKKLKVDHCIKIAITGANGKSSTTGLLAQILQKNGYQVAANLRGSNMRPGVFTGILEKTTFTGYVKADVILMEVDEFSSPKVYEAIQPDYLIVTNVLRDHIERQSDISNVIAKIEEKLGETTTLILNADDPIVSHIKYRSTNPRIYYGINDVNQGHKYAQTPLAGKFCLQCGKKLTYTTYFYEHMGHYYCPQCEFKRANLTYAITEMNSKENYMVLNGMERYHVNYQALYMYYNILAAITMAKILGLTYAQISKVTDTFSFGNARLEEFYLHERVGIMNFLKNATSLSATIDLLDADDNDKTVVFVMDDTYDGRYFITQWYWDAHVEKMAKNDSIKYFVCTWRRGYDMAIRLKAAGIPETKIIVELDMEKAIDRLRDETVGSVYLGYDTDSHSINKVVAALARYPENLHLRKEKSVE